MLTSPVTGSSSSLTPRRHSFTLASHTKVSASTSTANAATSSPPGDFVTVTSADDVVNDEVNGNGDNADDHGHEANVPDKDPFQVVPPSKKVLAHRVNL